MIFTKKRSLAIAGAASILFLSSVGSSNAIGLTTVPLSSFTNISAGAAANNVSSTSTLNFSTTANSFFPTEVDSFDGFFSTDFISVGAVGANNISSSSRGVNSTIRVASGSGFALSTSDVLQPLRISFNYIYRGTGDTSTTVPNFLVQIFRFANPGVDESISPFSTRNVLTVSASLAGLGTTISTNFGPGIFYAFDYRQTAASADVSLTGLSAGIYGISISLTEPTGGLSGVDNQAAGFNQFTVESIPFDFEPSLGIGLLGLGFGLNKVRKNWKAKKSIEV